MEKFKTCLVIALALAGAAAGCSDESSEAEYPAPAASVGDEASPQEAMPERTTPQPEAASEPATTTDEARATQQSPTMQPPTMQQPSQMMPPSPAMPGGTAEPVAESLRDAQILKITDLVNAGEVDQAKLAKTKATNPRVQKFAALMIKDHSAAKQRGMQLSKSASIMPEESKVAGELETKSSETLEKLQAADKSTFDKEYMTAQVKEHQEVLDMLDSKLIPSATTAKLKAELATTRAMIQHHLTEAQSVLQSLSLSD